MKQENPLQYPQSIINSAINRLIHILFLFVWVHGAAYAQIPLDSVFWVEKEDSLSSFSIKPVEDPEELLMRALERLEKDMQQKHSRRDYHLEGIFNVRTPPTLSVNRTFTVEDDNGIEIMKCENGPLHFEGPFVMTVQDSLDVEFEVCGPYTVSMYADERGIIMSLTKLFSNYKLKGIHRRIRNAYEVSAYSIEDEAGRGVYRIHFEKKESRKRFPVDWLYNVNSKIKWYIDRETLRLTQVNADHSVNSRHTLYRRDYGEENGSPVLKKSIELYIANNYVIHRIVIQSADN